MNVFIFFFLTTAVVTAAPHAASTSDKHQQKSGKTVNFTNHECHRKSLEGKKEGQYLLKNVMHNVKNLKMNLTAKTLQKQVQHVFMNEECSCETLCKAGKVLTAYNTSDLGLKSERDWRLHRMLQSYSENCSYPEELSTVPLDELLDKIHSCAQKEFANY